MEQLKNIDVEIINLGKVGYDEALKIQKEYFNEIIDLKLHNRNHPDDVKITPNYLLLCEHPHVYTLGKSGDRENLLINDKELKERGATFHEIGRGGDITYHGPGQLVGYPIFDLENFFTDIHKYLRFLEEAIIKTLQDYGIEAGRIEGLTGVWIDHVKQTNPRKICAFGVRASRWVTMHGFGFNVNADLSYFNYIVPCGITDKAVTSMNQEVGKTLDFNEITSVVVNHLKELFGFNIKEKK